MCLNAPASSSRFSGNTTQQSVYDFSVAAYKAFRSDYRSEECRREIFNNSLAGKEMDLSEETDDETENQVIQI